MFWIIDTPGQLCNRLWSYAAFISYALEHDRPLHILYFARYQELFQHLDVLPGIKFHHRIEWTYAPMQRLFYLIRKFPAPWRRLGVAVLATDVVGMEAPATSGDNVLLLVQSWAATVPGRYLQLRHADIRRVFQPRQKYVRRAEKLISGLRRSSDLLIGVHVRRGDYRDYLNGRYYFDDTTYRRVMEELAEQRSDKQVRFFLCSNEPIELDNFAGLPVFTLPSAAGIEDLHALSLCDYIFGPPSTYSMWASYYGQVPLQFITEGKDALALEKFSPIVSQNTFANGTTV